MRQINKLFKAGFWELKYGSPATSYVVIISRITRITPAQNPSSVVLNQVLKEIVKLNVPWFAFRFNLELLSVIMLPLRNKALVGS